MNDKEFIEELRQKRDEYGVTQTRLAVACGISREYYNRIEKGKFPLTEELKETLKKQIERFNPQEPLFLLIDYFRVRFPTTDAIKIIRDVLQLKADYMLYEDFGKYGYESKYVLGDINIMCSMQEHLGVLLELKGRGCRQMESYLLAQERSWYDFMLDCLTAGGKMKRLDLAINDKAGILDIPKLKEKYKVGECISYFRMQKDYSGTEKSGNDTPKNTGETLYLGSTSSELYMCAYQKNYEQYVKNGIEVEDTEIKNRFEIRMKNERAYYAVKAFKRVLKRKQKPMIKDIDGYRHFLFLLENGCPAHNATYKTLLIRMIKKYNKTHNVPLPHITPHTLRHTFCTRLAQKNMNPKNLQYIMGHSNITITLNLYAHASEIGANKEMRSMIA